MAFMSPVAEYMAVYYVETNNGTELVPEDVCGEIDTDMANASEAGLDAIYRTVLCSYLEGSRIVGDIERKEGWYARLSAPGYLDCTSWDGPYPTKGEALGAVQDFYDVDASGDPND